jgi:tetratricopeptide (TPR) repeat protein
MTVRQYAFFFILLLAIAVVYSNHFQNSFHFDDAHTIEANVHIRSLGNIPKFFEDPKTFSNLPTHQVYRPLLTTTLALDYVRGGGGPVAFRVTNMVLFGMLIWTVWRLYGIILDGAWAPALIAASLYALHPVVAETINYIIQRGDLLSTLGVVCALLVYIRFPRQRKYGIYLLPLVAALLVKPPALVFPVLLFAWVFLFEREGDWRESARAVVPAFAVCAAMGWVLAMMTAGSFNAGGTSTAAYRITQLYVTFYYFTAFFAPLHLTADTDRTAFSGFDDPRAWLGAAFVSAIILAIRYAAKRREWRPVSFGLVWFLAALFPTAWMPLAEIANDHRMFFPFVGLAPAVVQSMHLLLRNRLSRPVWRYAGACFLTVVFALEAHGTRLRNEVWRSEETLWRDAVEKSPRNGRALMNYASTLMRRNSIKEALPYFERAHEMLPNYFILEINLAICYGAAGRGSEAEAHFLRALQLEPKRYESHFFYARWLREQGRNVEAGSRLVSAIASNAYALDARHVWMQMLAENRDWFALRTQAAETLALVPADPEALRMQALAQNAGNGVEAAAAVARQQPSPENWLTYSLVLYQTGKYQESIEAARQSLLLRPDYAEAWNNIAAAHNALREWSEGIRAADEALRLNPAFELARNNRAWAVSQQQVFKR